MKTDYTDLKRAFIPVTADLQAGIEDAFERGEREMKKRHKIMSLLSIAAVLALVFGVAGLAANEMYTPKEDNVVLSAGETALVPSEEAELVSAEESEREEPDFMYVDPAEADALQTLLNMAYRDYCEFNGIEMESQCVDVHALNSLQAIPGEYGEETENWIQPIIDVLKGYLGFDLDYIEENRLTNYVVACLSMQPDVEYNIEAVSERIWNDALENYLTEAYTRYCEEKGTGVYAGVLYRTAGELLDIPMKYGEDEALWAQPIALCLQEEMGLDAEYIEEWNLIEGITVSLGEKAAGPEAEEIAVELTEQNAVIEGAYLFAVPAETEVDYIE